MVSDKYYKTKLRISQPQIPLDNISNNSLTIQNLSHKESKKYISKTHLSQTFLKTNSWLEYKTNLAKTQVKPRKKETKIKYFIPLNVTRPDV